MFTTKIIGGAGACLLIALLGIIAHGVHFDNNGTVPISTVESYQGLVDVAGKVDDAGTGERFEKEVIMLLYKSGECEADFEKYDLMGFAKHASDDVAFLSADVDAVDETFKDKFNIEMTRFTCPTGIVIHHRSLIHKPDFKSISSNKKNESILGTSILRTQDLYVGTVNDYPFPITVYYKWLDGPETIHLKEVLPGKEIWMRSYRTTELIAKTMEGKELQRMRVSADSLFTVADRYCNIEDCGIIERPKEVKLDQYELQKRIANDKFRLSNNVVQPQGLPRFTEVGFKKIRVPDDVWDTIISYYRNNKNRPKIEQWQKGNVYTNNIEAPSFMVNLPEIGGLKPKVFGGLRPILEEWSGVKLVPTSCYGIRAYTEGSWLSNHVDTRNTHAVSAIINIDQDVTEPWPLMIFDHAGNSHNITMAPRDMVLYESAVCVHGRPTTLQGKFYTNMFVHFKPKDPENWDKYISTS
mmetsp:Transcript_11376/g.16920  ORF Transcript_11376/g.16920 Transcript_11376/m.16920 type:complete len:468 (-) Transcript_11376:74-1477(-)